MKRFLRDLASWPRRAIKAFYVWNVRYLVRMIVLRVGPFEKMRIDDLLKVAGLERSDLSDPSLLLAKLHDWLEGVGADLSVRFFLRLCTALTDDGMLDLVAALCERDAGLDPEDYAHPDRLLLRLQERTRDLPPSTAFLYALQIGNALAYAAHTSEELAVFQANLGISSGDYQDQKKLEQVLGSPRQGVAPGLWAMAVQSLAASLGRAGRFTELVAVLEAALGINEADYSSPPVLREKILASLSPRDQMVSVGYLMVLPTALRQLGHGSEALALVEADFGFERADYHDARQLATKMKMRTESLPLEVASPLLTSLYGSLILETRPDDALSALAADAGFDPEHSDPREVAAALETRYRFLPENLRINHLGMAALVLVSANRPLLAVAALGTDADLNAVDWRDADALAMRLNVRLGNLDPVVRLFYVGEIVSALAVAGSEDRAALLVDAYVRKLMPLHQKERSALAHRTCQIYDRWLFWWAADARRQPLEICQAIVSSLRLALASQGITIRDRQQFIRMVGTLRRRIVQTGLYWVVRQSDPENAVDLRRTVLLWDLELAQRLLVERFLLTEIRLIPAGEAPREGWPFSSAPPPTESYLPEAGAISAAAGVLGKVEDAG